MNHEDAHALLEPFAFMTKVDIANTYYRTVGIHPDDHELMSFKWEFDGVMRYCRDKRATMGHKKSPEFFCRLSQAVRAILAAEGLEASVVFAHDFFQTERLEYDSEEAREHLSELLVSLGSPSQDHNVTDSET